MEQTVVRQALAEHVRPVLHVNKLDRGILEMSWNAEEMYKNLESVIENVNVVLARYRDDILGDVSVDPLKGSVSFGSGKQGWAFTLPQFARIFAKRFNQPYDKILKRLWGAHYLDPETNQFQETPVSPSGKTLPRFFCQVVMEPLIRVFTRFGPTVAIDAPRDAEADKILKGIGVVVSPAKWESFKSPSERLKYIMLTWLPAGDALTELIVEHLPSPRQAQQYRYEALYNGPADSDIALSIKKCDPEGPLVFFVSKMIPTRDEKRMLCFGRIFSGTMRSGQKVRVMAPGYEPGVPAPPGALVVDKPIHRINVQTRFETMDAIHTATCGNLVALSGLDSYILKTATISDSADAHTIRSVKFSVSPVVAVAVEPKNPAHLPRLLDALRHLGKVNQMLRITTSEKGENIIAGVGELHLEIALEELQDIMNREVPIMTSRPVVDFMETITAPSSITTLAKSANKHNRVQFTAEPIPEGFAPYAQHCTSDAKERARLLMERFPDAMDPDSIKRIWGFAPDTEWQNLVTQSSVGVQAIQSIKESVLGGFGEACAVGVLCGEPLRNCRFNLVDAVLHQDPKHAGFGQVMPAVRRAIQAAQLASRPRLVEPVYKVEIQAPIDCSGAIHNVLSKRRGFIVGSEQRFGSPIVSTIAHLPVAESFGFAKDLREASGGRAFPSMAVDHWQVIEDDPLEEGTLSYKLVQQVRERKGLPATVPTLDKLNDRL